MIQSLGGSHGITIRTVVGGNDNFDSTFNRETNRIQKPGRENEDYSRAKIRVPLYRTIGPAGSYERRRPGVFELVFPGMSVPDDQWLAAGVTCIIGELDQVGT